MRASRTPGGKLPGLRFLAGSDVSLCKETWQSARFGAPRPAGLCELQRNVMDGGRGEGEARRLVGVRAAALRVYSDCGGPVSRGEWWPVRGAFVAAMRESFEGIKADRNQTLLS
nr:uncharacterized protein LOC114103329 [Marmota flaviventris]